MKGLVAILLVMMASIVAAGVCYWIYRPPLAHIAIAIDGSESVTPRCNGVMKSFSGSLETQHGFRNGSTVSVLAMGKSRRDKHPRLQLQEPIPFPSDDVYGVNREAEEQKMLEFVQGLEKHCEAAHGAADSPIYEMIHQALSHLRSESVGCALDGHCKLLVKSDLEEDVHLPLKQTLDALRTKPDTMLPEALVASLDNTGITVTVCGLSERKPRAGSSRRELSQDLLARTWKALFLHPERVNLQPYCQ